MEKVLVKVRRISQSEVEVLRKAICLEETFLEAGAALEKPGIGEVLVRADRGQKPAENKVLLDDVRIEALPCGGIMISRRSITGTCFPHRP